MDITSKNAPAKSKLHVLMKQTNTYNKHDS